MFSLNLDRCRNLVSRSIEVLKLDLRELVVLTEAATGYFALTASIAAAAGAEHVYAMARDSIHGSSQEAAEETARIARKWGFGNRVSIINDRCHPGIGKADIVTNLGSVRPIDHQLISQLKKTVVIPLMFETWEFRSVDLDLDLCRRQGIPVLGTNENAPELAVFSYLGPLVCKLLHECEIEINRSNVIVVGSGIFGQTAVAALKSAAANVFHVDLCAESGILSKVLRPTIASADAIIFIEHCNQNPLLLSHEHFRAEDLKSINPGLVVVHIAGNVNREDLEKAGIRCWPNRFAPVGYMSVTTAYVGPKPLVDLHTGGLKVGELLARARLRGISREGCEAEALHNIICQSFLSGSPKSLPV